MNEGFTQGAISTGYANELAVNQKISMAHQNTTVAQNIDNRIEQLQEQIDRLETVKVKLMGGSILDVSLNDLQMAMGRY